MLISDLYGIKINSIKEAKDILEKLLSITPTEHDSSYLGEYYSFSDSVQSEEKLKLRSNECPMDDEPVEEEFPEWEFLFYVDVYDEKRSQEIELQICNKAHTINLLRRESN